MRQKRVFVCVHLHMCMRAGVLCSPAPYHPPLCPFKRRGDHPLKCFYTTPHPPPLGSFTDALFCLSSLMRLAQPCLASQPIGEHLRSMNDLFFCPLLLSYHLRCISTELNLNHCLIYASHTSAAAETMQVKTMEPS